MIHRRQVCLLLFILTTTFGYTQDNVPATINKTDSIEKEILNYTDTQTELITKGRRLLLDRFTAGDLQKVKEVKDYLKNQVENRDYVVLFPFEHWLILYWTKEYTELINLIKNPDAFEYTRVNRIAPQQDILYERIREKSLISISKLTSEIYLSGLSEVDNDFLVLYLNAILSGKSSTITQDKLNDLADEFILKYPQSEYNKYIRENLRFKFVPSKWGFAYEFFSGYGMATGNLANHFTNNIPIGVAFDVQYKNLSLYLRDYIGFSKLKNDISYPDGTWKAKSQVRVFVPEATLGYVVMDRNRVKLAPFAGIGGVNFSPTEKDISNEPFLKNANTGGFSYMAGFNLDIKLGKDISFNEFNSGVGFGFIRIRYSYCMPRLAEKYDGMTGNMHCFTVGIGAFGRTVKRDK